eukprot:scaffold15305_cov126-Cylindrotheca_fusiformis.AAC.1
MSPIAIPKISFTRPATGLRCGSREVRTVAQQLFLDGTVKVTMSTDSQFTPTQLRQRRARFLRDHAREVHEKRDLNKSISRNTTNTSVYFLKLYVVVGLALIFTFAAFLNHTRPRFLFGSPTKRTPFHLVSIYPPGMRIEAELPRFFRSYSISTPQNEKARRSVIKNVNSRRVLSRRSGSFRTFLKTWDASSVNKLLERGICGTDFEEAYISSSDERKNDLIMWCLMTASRSEGFFLSTIEIVESPLLLTKGRGIVVKDPSTPSALSLDFYMDPRNATHEQDLAFVPSKLLDWMLDNEEIEGQDYREYRRKAQNYLYDLVFSDGREDNFLIFQEVCQPQRPPRTMGENCRADSCCYIVVPEIYGGSMFDHSSSDD